MRQIRDAIRDTGESPSPPDAAKTAAKWMTKIIPDWPNACVNSSTHDLWKVGIPPMVRGRVWFLAMGDPFNITADFYRELLDVAAATVARDEAAHASSSPETAPAVYGASVLGQPRQTIPVGVILRAVNELSCDVPRTFPECRAVNNPEFHKRLHRLLLAYVTLRASSPSVRWMSSHRKTTLMSSYVQGMSFIAAVVLLYAQSDEEALAMVACLFEHPFPQPVGGRFPKPLSNATWPASLAGSRPAGSVQFSAVATVEGAYSCAARNGVRRSMVSLGRLQAFQQSFATVLRGLGHFDTSKSEHSAATATSAASGYGRSGAVSVASGVSGSSAAQSSHLRATSPGSSKAPRSPLVHMMIDGTVVPMDAAAAARAAAQGAVVCDVPPPSSTSQRPQGAAALRSRDERDDASVLTATSCAASSQGDVTDDDTLLDDIPAEDAIASPTASAVAAASAAAARRRCGCTPPPTALTSLGSVCLNPFCPSRPLQNPYLAPTFPCFSFFTLRARLIAVTVATFQLTLQTLQPRIHDALRSLQVGPSMYFYSWAHSLFSTAFTPEGVAVLIDLMLLDGSVVMHAAAVALLWRKKVRRGGL